MRLLCITNLFPDTTQPWRGLDNVTLLHAMKALKPTADIRVLCLRPGHKYWLNPKAGLKPRPGDEDLNPLYHWAPYLPKFGGLNDALFGRAVRKALKTLPPGWRPDALLVPWLFPDACGVNRCAELAGVPMMAVAQGSDVHRYLHMPHRRRAIHRLSRRALIITRSEDLRQRLIRSGTDSEWVKTVYNGVDTNSFRPGDKLEAREALNLPTEGKLALFVGNFVKVKGLDLLIQAVGRVKRQMKEPLHLVMIGSGPLEAELLALAKTIGLEDGNLILAGRRGPGEVAQFMRAADAVCLSSHNEGVPNVLFEAFASGRPLVTTDVGGIAEIAAPSPGGGFLLKERKVDGYAGQLLTALMQPPDAAVLSSYAGQFAWERCAREYWDCLEKCTDAPAR